MHVERSQIGQTNNKLIISEGDDQIFFCDGKENSHPDDGHSPAFRSE